MRAGGAVCAVSERRSMSSAPEQLVMAAEKKPVVKHTLKKPPKGKAPAPKAKTGTESPRKGESGTHPGEKSNRSKFREVLVPALCCSLS